MKITSDKVGFRSRVTKMWFSLLFTIKMIVKNLSNRKLSTAVITLGLVFAMTGLFTATIWTETSQKIIAEDYINSLDYELYVTTYLTGAMSDVYEFLNTDPVVEQVDYAYETVALFNFEDKSPEYIWFPEDEQENMSNPLSLTHALLVPSRALERIKLNFEIEGNASLNPGEVMISYFEAKELEAIYHRTIKPGDNITVAVSRRIPNTDIGEIRMKYFDIANTTFANYTIAGIYQYVGKDTIIDLLYGGGVDAATIVDSILFPLEALTEEDISIIDSNGILPKLLVKTEPKALSADGIAAIPDKILALQERIKTRFYHAYTRALSEQIKTMVDEYKRMFGSNALLIPTLVIAMFLTVLATQMTIQRRGNEVTVLRSRGALSYQIAFIFFGESLIISVISWIVSFLLSLLILGFTLSLSVTKITGLNAFQRFLSNLMISPYAIEINTLLVIGTYLLITAVHVVSFVTKDIQESLILTERGKKAAVIAFFITLFIFVTTSFLFQLLDYFRKFDGSLQYDLDLIEASAKTLIFYIFVCFFIILFLTEIIFKVLNRSKRIFISIFKNQGFLLYKNFTRRDKNLKGLLLFFLLLTTFSTFYLTVQKSVQNNIILENEYRIGADIRIQTTVPVDISEFETKIAAIHGIKNVMGLYSVRASIGASTVEVFGVDPEKYEKIGRWGDYSFAQQNYKEALTKLENDTWGIIISNHMAYRLGLDIGDKMFVTDFRGGPFYLKLNVTAIMYSAPGLGFAHGYDPKMARGTSEFVIVNEKLITDEVGVGTGSLFLAKVEKGVAISSLIETIQGISPYFIVNPEKINPRYVGFFLGNYLPSVRTIVLVGTIFLVIMAVVNSAITTDFIMEQRRNEYALLLAMGTNRAYVRKFILSETLVAVAISTLIGIPLGIILTAIALFFIKPLLIPAELVPIKLLVNVWHELLLIVLLIIALVTGAIPTLFKQIKHEIVKELRRE